MSSSCFLESNHCSVNDCCLDTLRKELKALGFSWKKAHKLLNKENPDNRAALLTRLEGLVDKAWYERCLLVYLNEARFHLDTEEGYSWSVKGERVWISSSISSIVTYYT